MHLQLFRSGREPFHRSRSRFPCRFVPVSIYHGLVVIAETVIAWKGSGYLLTAEKIGRHVFVLAEGCFKRLIGGWGVTVFSEIQKRPGVTSRPPCRLPRSA